MPVTPEFMLAWCQTLLDVDGRRPQRSLSEYLAAIPRLDALNGLPSGSTVLVRGDLDAKPGAQVGQGDIRLRSMRETLDFGRQHGWKQVVFGHIGRKGDETLAKVANRLAEILGCEIPLVSDWLDPDSNTIRESAAQTIRAAAAGSVLVLENTRRYPIERALWNARPQDLAGLAEPLSRFANEFAEKIATVYVNEALSAGSLDASTVIVPATMRQVALGRYVAHEFDGPMKRCLDAELIIFSGLKIDKLDDLEAMVRRGAVKTVFAAGSLAMSLLKGAAELDGRSFSMGVAEDPKFSDKPFYIPPQRIQQAKGMIEHGRKKGIEFVLPIDFVLGDGRISETIGPNDQQFDIGPKTSELFERKIGEFIEQHRGHRAAVFHNGVFGMFEDARFESGTKRFMAQLKRLKDAGIEVYIGGGEGGAALEKYGRESDVTHVFTAGGTVLNALGGEPVPYLVALAMGAEKERQASA